MTEEGGHALVLLVSGAAPYLGGPATWLALRAAMPDVAFIEIDTLDFAYLRDLEEAADLISASLRGADAVVAHYSVAKLVLEVVAREHRTLPVVLLSPLLLTRMTLALRVTRGVFGYPPGSWSISAIARAKLRRLSNDRTYLARTLALFLGRDASDVIIEEALRRIRDPRSKRIAERTAEFLRNGLMPLDPAASRMLDECVILVGGSRLDRRTAKRFRVTVLPKVDAAPMLQAPDRVARAIRDVAARSAQNRTT